jgi:aryl-alcohol dehydrogenase-like predicted oxidoreductase
MAVCMAAGSSLQHTDETTQRATKGTAQMVTPTPTPTAPGGTWNLGDRVVARVGYGAMQLAGPGVMGPPADRDAAIEVLRAAVELGVTHIDTSGAYGPRTTNQIIREALHPYDPSLVIATKVGAVRDRDGGWPPARDAESIRRAVHQDLEDLGVERLDVVNLRLGDATGPQPGSVTAALEVLAELQRDGLIAQLGVSNATAEQVAEAQDVAPIVCVQNLYNLALRHDDELIDRLAPAGIAYVPFFPLGGFTPLQAQGLSSVAARMDTTRSAVALAWLLQRSPNILLIPGTSSPAHLRDNVAAAELVLSADDLAELDAIGRPPATGDRAQAST